MATKLQEARERVRAAEAARIALAAKHAEEDAAQAPAKLALERHVKRYNAPVVILTAGSYKIFAEGIGSLSGYGWDGEVRRAMDGYKGKAREERAIAMVSAGEITFSLNGSSLKCKGLAQKTRVVTGTHLKAWQRARDKVRKAEEAARLARNEEVATIRTAFDAGDRLTVDQIAAIVGRKAMLQSAVRTGDPWSRDRAIAEARKVCETADAHLAHILAKSTDPCPCSRCVGDRNSAEYEAKAEVRRKEMAKAAAAAQRIKDRAPWREYTCPSCANTVIAQPLPKTAWDGATSKDLYLRCTVDRCHWSALASSIKTKPAKKPETVAA